MKSHLFLCIGILFVFFFSGNALAATLHVGTGQTYSTIQDCADDAQPGDTCLVHEETYSGVDFPRSGTAGNRITIIADTSGSQPVVTSSFDFGSRSYLTVEGFYMDGASFSGNGCSFVEILNNTISKTGGGVGQIRPGNDMLISGNTFAGLTSDIFNQWGRRWVIRDNIVTDIVDINDVHLDFWQSFCSPSEPEKVPADFTLVENNLYAEISGSNVHFFLFHSTEGCASDDGTNYILRYNKVRYIGSNAVTFDDGASNADFVGASIYNNNFVQLSEGSHSSWKDYIGGIAVVQGTVMVLNNILYDAVDYAGAEVAYPSNIPVDGSLVYDPDNTVTTDGALQTCGSNCIINQDPLFTNYVNDDYSLQPGSPAINAGKPLTSVASGDSGSGTSLIVDNAYPFQPGWAGVDPDWIAVGSVSNVVQISSIDYDTGTITLASPISRNNGDPIWLYKDSDGTVVLHGDAPDIGAVEFHSGPIDGSCGSTENSCTSGTLNDITDNSTHYKWECMGSGGGSTASCSLLFPPACTDPCDDGDSCTSGDVCVGDTCQGTIITTCSMTSDSCCPGSCDYTNDADCSAPTQLCDNLVSLYHLNGDVTDSSGNGNYGTVSGAIPTSGLYSGAYIFDQDTDYIQVPTTGMDTSQGTVSAWASYQGFVSSPNYIFGHSNSDSSWADRIQIYTDDSAGLLDLGLGDSHTTSTGLVNLDPGSWYHIVLTWNSTDYAIYVNGTEADSGGFSGFSTFRTFLDIGNDGNPTYRNEGFNGSIDDVAIWNRSLSSQEVSDIYTSGQPITCSQAQYHPADLDESCDIDQPELIAYIDNWYMDSTGYPMRVMMEAVGYYYSGSYC